MKEKSEPEKRFIVDSMLGKVAKWLRILGFDARYERLTHQKQLDEYREEGFLMITRNQRWCGQPHVICLWANDPMEQLHQVVSQVPISCQEVRPFRRCILCNQPLDLLSRDQTFDLVPDYVFETNTLFYQCSNCQKIYWSGTHPKRMRKRLQEVLGWSL
jgi:uncharacterized protein with PIN domain